MENIPAIDSSSWKLSIVEDFCLIESSHLTLESESTLDSKSTLESKIDMEVEIGFGILRSGVGPIVPTVGLFPYFSSVTLSGGFGNAV